MLWVLNLSDGTHSLLDIAERAGLEFGLVKTAADALEGHGLLREALKETRSRQQKKRPRGKRARSTS